VPFAVIPLSLVCIPKPQNSLPRSLSRWYLLLTILWTNYCLLSGHIIVYCLLTMNE